MEASSADDENGRLEGKDLDAYVGIHAALAVVRLKNAQKVRVMIPETFFFIVNYSSNKS